MTRNDDFLSKNYLNNQSIDYEELFGLNHEYVNSSNY